MTRRALVLAALVLGLAAPAAVAVAPGPALAADYGTCLPVVEDGQIVDWACIPLPAEDPEEFDDPRAIGLAYGEPVPQPWWVADLVVGFGYLDQAVTHPREAGRLRAAAQDSFLAAAARLGPVELRLGAVGVVDRERNMIDPDPTPWLVAAGADLVDGVRLLQQALAEPDPTPWLAAAMDQFTESYQELAQQEVIGR